MVNTCVGSSEEFSKFDNFLGELTDSAYNGTHSYDLFNEKLQSKISKRQGLMEQSPEKTRHKLLNPLPMKSHAPLNVCLIPPATDCNNTSSVVRKAH